MVKFIMMIGVPGSGKSTVAEKLAIEHDAEIYSSDAYRAKLLGNANDQSNGNLIFETLYKDIRGALNNNRNVILDATNVDRRARRSALKNIEGISCYKIGVCVITPIEECIKRDAFRDRNVGDTVINKFQNRLTIPTADEGFDEIIQIFN